MEAKTVHTATPQIDADYWYDHRHELEVGQIFLLSDGSIVELDHRVPGDGTKWYVLDWSGRSWSCMDSTIEPGELRSMPFADIRAALAAAEQS